MFTLVFHNKNYYHNLSILSQIGMRDIGYPVVFDNLSISDNELHVEYAMNSLNYL